MKNKGKILCLIYILVLLSYVHNTKQEDEEDDEEQVNRSMFSRDFVFGVTTSAFQIEGGYLEDGKSLNNWDVFTHLPGIVVDGSNGDVADDHYHRYMEDIEALHFLGVNAYRFSISWARILPRGMMGEVNDKGVMFYNSIIDNLLLRGIEPFVTIHHLEMPIELEKKYGGWLDPLIQEEYVQLAKTCFEKFGDRVKYWVTINQPNLYTEMSYLTGVCPPNHCSPPFGNCSVGHSDVEPLLVLHYMLLSHAKAVRLYRLHFQGKQRGVIGMVTKSDMREPFRDTHLHRQAVARALAFSTAWVLDPLIYGYYPPEMQEYLGKELPRFTEEEEKTVKGSVDFIGINHYSTLYVMDCLHSSCNCSSPGASRPISGFICTTGFRDGIPIGEPTGWEIFYVVPRGLEEILEYLTTRYPEMPLFVTENGYCLPQDSDEKQIGYDDVKRIKFHTAYLAAIARAMRKGAKVKGYFIWSLMDSLEWTNGFTTKYGLYYVNRTTLNRTPKLSAKWYADFLSTSKTDAEVKGVGDA